jgi:hypothetical protein
VPVEKEATAAQILGRFVWRKNAGGGRAKEEEGAG